MKNFTGSELLGSQGQGISSQSPAAFKDVQDLDTSSDRATRNE
jgi:hypothetical protein